MKILLLISFFLNTMAFAQDCSDVNLITQPKSPFEKIPVYDQSASGMCYAFSASELVNYELLKTGKANSLVVHPAWAGLRGSRVNGQEILRSGLVERSIEGIIRNGNCPYENVVGSIGALARTVGVPEGRILKFIDDYGNLLKEGLGRRPALNAAARKNSNICAISNWEKIFPQLENFSGSGVDIADNLMASSCRSENLSPLNLGKPNVILKGTHEDFERELMRTLDANRPATVTFCSWATDRAQGASLRGVSVDGNMNRSTTLSKEACGMHVALFAGKKMVNNSCHFLYYNSKGSGWNSDNRHLTCLCKKRSDGKFVDDCKAATHPAGQYSVEACWVPSEVLIPNSVEIDHY